MKVYSAELFCAFAGNKTRGKLVDADGDEFAVARESIAAIDPSFNLDSSRSRRIPYLLSTNAVARDGHTVKSDGFDLMNYRANPVFLWAHSTGEPPIGRMVDIAMSATALKGTVEYADADLSPFADMIYRMVKKRFLNAVSISWQPLEWKFSTDPKRIGGVDFIRQDLLEVSQVPVPAMASALATARASGIDTAPMVRWAEQVLDRTSGTPNANRRSVEEARQAALSQYDPIQDRARERRRRAVEALSLRVSSEDAAVRRRYVKALSLVH